MQIVDFKESHIQDASCIALANYNEETAIVKALPTVSEVPDLTCFAQNGLGVAAIDNGKTIGYLCCYAPWDNAFDSAAMGTFSPMHAHGAIKENRGRIYKYLYQAAAEKWVKRGIAYHALALYAHDDEAINAMFTYGFGLRCMDVMRDLEPIATTEYSGIIYKEFSDPLIIRSLRKDLSNHLGASPCFMKSSDEDFENRLKRAESRGTRLFGAFDDSGIIAFVEVGDDGENFATETFGTKNICGAYCLPPYRGKDIFRNLLNHVVSVLKSENYARLGVDFESFNPTAYGFWLKHFEAYTKSVVRRIDECAL